MRKQMTHTHSHQELVLLRAALHKAAEKLGGAIAANRAAGVTKIADDLQKQQDALVGHGADQDGSVSDRLKQVIERAEAGDGQATFSFGPVEAHAIEVGLPLLGRRLRSMEGELSSLGRQDVADWCREQSEHCEGVLVGHYADQQELL